jgi:hypothetical protein
MSPQEFEHYCASIRDTGIWGGEPEILALSRAYNVPIHVVQGGKPPVVVHNPTVSSTDDQMTDKVVRISYHRRMYGLGEVSLTLNECTGNSANCSYSITTLCGPRLLGPKYLMPCRACCQFPDRLSPTLYPSSQIE